MQRLLGGGEVDQMFGRLVPDVLLEEAVFAANSGRCDRSRVDSAGATAPSG